MPDFEDRVVLITGASGGLGRAVRDAFLAEGATVVAVARSIGEDREQPNCLRVAADLTSVQGVRSVLDQALQRAKRLDVLVHVMGAFAGGSTVAETDEAVWDRMMALNLRSAFLVTRAALAPMISAGYGRIVAVGSRTGVEPTAGLGAYGVSKAGLNSLVQTIAEEVKGQGITANVVLPSIIDTPANRKAMPKADFAKWVTSEAIARQILWLASQEAGEVNGALIPMYGGV